MPASRDFIGKPAPPGYIAGVGRGATGFTTRSDIGPAREVAAASTSGDGAGPSRKMMKRSNDDEEEEEDPNENNYDEFFGYGGSLFNKTPYDEADEEADRIYDAIDKHMAERGKARRERKARQELERYRRERPKIQQQFSDLKEKLKNVTEEQWMSIPEVGDARNRKQRVARQDKYTPVPDSLIAHQAKLASGGERLVYIDPTAVDPDAMDTTEDNVVDKANPIGEMSNVRGSNLSMLLSRVSSAAVSQTVTNPLDYLTKLQSMPTQITDAATLKDRRLQFAAIRNKNPSFPNGWIASVRLEEAAGELSKARALVREACEKCPKSVDIWCELARLYPPDKAKSYIVPGLQQNPKSVRLWLKAADLENDDENKRRVYEKARELIPNSVLLWQKSVELEEPAGARRLLREAVECCPKSVDLWLALARLEPYEEARRVLIRANEKNTSDKSIWITRAMLEEAASDEVSNEVINIIKQAIHKLVDVKRDEWLKEAIDAERINSKVTCREIVRQVIGANINDDVKLNTWLADAQFFISNNSFECARAVYETIVEDKNFSRLESVWLSFVGFEHKHGTKEYLVNLLKRSTKSCSKSETLWLMYAIECNNDLEGTREIYRLALRENPASEKIIIAAAELECRNGQPDRAREILKKACESAKTPQLVMKSAELELSQGDLHKAVDILEKGAEEYKNFPEFHLRLGQIEKRRGDSEKAKKHYSDGLKFNPTSVELWINMANIEEETGFIAKARSRLERARLRNPKEPRLWLEAAKLEMRAHNIKGGNTGRPDIVTTLLAKGIKECKDHPNAEILYAEQASINKRKPV